MPSETGSGTTDAGSGNLEVLRRIRSAEAEWETRLRSAQEGWARQREQLRSEIEQAVRDAQAEAERLRETMLTEARGQADRAAEQIVTEGREAAEAIALRTSGQIARKRSEILDALLGDLRPSEK
ncbi:MAG TPA: hypothetical protein VJS68_01880 [Thermoplasmata archaeon]|nr:hypothetical protein [Thermoplasmata archaeon]